MSNPEWDNYRPKNETEEELDALKKFVKKVRDLRMYPPIGDRQFRSVLQDIIKEAEVICQK